MDIKKAREELKELGMTVPRSNDDVAKLFRETFPEVELDYAESNVVSIKEEPVIEVEKDDIEKVEIYTYVGAGHEPPSVINFLWRQSFIRGNPV